MGCLTVPIDQILSSLGHIKFYQPLIECLTNSLEANAKNITVELDSSEMEGRFNQIKYVKRITVTDNGDGFTQADFAAFKDYRTKNKIHLGCKGVGRLTWLKIFDKAEIQSVVRENGKVLKKNFVFDENFNIASLPNEIEISTDTKKIGTSVILSGLRDEESSVPEDIKKLRDDILIELLPKLLLMNRKFVITFRSNRPGIEIQIIKSSDLPQLLEIPFEIKTKDSIEKFVLKYVLSNGAPNEPLLPRTHAYHCANRRAVETFESKDLTVNLSAHDKRFGVFLLESSYFDKHVNDVRNKIEIQDDSLLDGIISWDHINEKLRQILTKLIYDKWPALEQEAEKDKDSLAEEHPHLSSYIKKFNVVGRIEEKEAVQAAEKHFEKAKKLVRQKYKELLQKHHIKEENIEEFHKLAANTTELGKQELAEYIWYRKVIIDMMEKLLGREEDQESVIHNLIMPMKTNDKERIEDNNLWLLDDKFSLYQYAASDLEINQICDDVFHELYPDETIYDDKDRPDLCIFFSDSKASSDDLEAIIIELKKFTAKKFDKAKGLDQLGFYANAFSRRNPRFKKFWVYLVVDKVEPDFETLLNIRGYQRFFCQNGTAYLHYIELNGARVHLSVFTMSALTANAKARNHKFLEIVKSAKFENSPQIVVEDNIQSNP